MPPAGRAPLHLLRHRSPRRPHPHQRHHLRHPDRHWHLHLHRYCDRQERQHRHSQLRRHRPPPVTSTCVVIQRCQGRRHHPGPTMTPTGGTGTGYTFSVPGLPAGLTLTSGTISGTPTVTGTFTYAVTVNDYNGNTGTFSCAVTVPPPSPPPASDHAVQGVASPRSPWPPPAAREVHLHHFRPPGRPHRHRRRHFRTPTVPAPSPTPSRSTTRTAIPAGQLAPSSMSPATATCATITAVQGVAITPGSA